MRKRAGSVSDTSPTGRSHDSLRDADVIGHCFLLSSQDTDSLMEWWYTVERESHSPSLYSQSEGVIDAVALLSFRMG